MVGKRRYRNIAHLSQTFWKTFTVNMPEYFFSVKYVGHGDLFEHLERGEVSHAAGNCLWKGFQKKGFTNMDLLLRERKYRLEVSEAYYGYKMFI